jgi:hypothetical protein
MFLGKNDLFLGKNDMFLGKNNLFLGKNGLFLGKGVEWKIAAIDAKIAEVGRGMTKSGEPYACKPDEEDKTKRPYPIDALKAERLRSKRALNTIKQTEEYKAAVGRQVGYFLARLARFAAPSCAVTRYS